MPDGDDLALDGLFLGGVGDDDPTLGGGLGRDPLDDDPVVQRPDLHDLLIALLKSVRTPREAVFMLSGGSPRQRRRYG
ncbi:MAG: hypothetical protein R3F65_00395 [bacterium]